MRLSWRRSSRAEDRFEAWITESHQKWVLAGGTTPVGPCPDEAFLRDLARKSRRIKLSDPRVDHAATCPTCLNQLLGFRQEIRSRRRKGLAVVGLVTACLASRRHSTLSGLAMGCNGISGDKYGNRLPDRGNLWDVGTFRGEQPGSTATGVAARGRCEAQRSLLPRFSPPGHYLVAVTRDQSAMVSWPKAARRRSPMEKRKRSPSISTYERPNRGQYFLSTTNEQDQASYYYPLQIK